MKAGDAQLIGKVALAGIALFVVSRLFHRRTVAPAHGGSASPGTGTGEPTGEQPALKVEPLETPMPPSVAIELFQLAVKQELGAFEDPRVLHNVSMMIAAQAAFETGDFQKMFHFNFGNITTGGGRDFYVLPGDTTHKYVVFRTPESGVLGMVRLVLRKYQSALAAAKAGEPIRYAHELKMGGYYEGPEDSYAKGVKFFFEKFDVEHPLG